MRTLNDASAVGRKAVRARRMNELPLPISVNARNAKIHKPVIIVMANVLMLLHIRQYKARPAKGTTRAPRVPEKASQ